MGANRMTAMVLSATLLSATLLSAGGAAALTKAKVPRRPRRTVTTTVITTPPTTAPDSTPAPATVGGSPLDWARAMVQNVTEATTDYDHNLGPVTWTGEHGAAAYESRTDCSGFILALYEQAYSVTLPQLSGWLGKKRPLAASFVDAIGAGHGFSAVSTVAEIQPGDLIAVRYANPAKGDNTGHLMLVESSPTARAATNPLVDGTTQWDVNIIDQSSTGHGPTDTRHHADKTFASGVGRGTIRLYTDSAGSPVGYAWSDIGVSPFYSQSDRPLVIGRLDPGHAW